MRQGLEVAVESADPDDAGELGRSVVVVEHEVAVRREVPEVASDGIVRVWGALGGPLSSSTNAKAGSEPAATTRRSSLTCSPTGTPTTTPTAAS
jgi:hypothetical protein